MAAAAPATAANVLQYLEASSDFLGEMESFSDFERLRVGEADKVLRKVLAITCLTVAQATVLANKIKSSKFSAAQKDSLQQAVASRVELTAPVAESHGGAFGRRTVQDFTRCPHFFTQRIWDVLVGGNPAEHKVEVVVRFLGGLTLRSASESTFAMFTALSLPADAAPPSPEQLHQKLQVVKASARRILAALPELTTSYYISTLPSSPDQLPATLMQAVYPVPDRWVECQVNIDQLNTLARSIPLRSTNSLVRVPRGPAAGALGGALGGALTPVQHPSQQILQLLQLLQLHAPAGPAAPAPREPELTIFRPAASKSEPLRRSASSVLDILPPGPRAAAPPPPRSAGCLALLPPAEPEPAHGEGDHAEGDAEAHETQEEQDEAEHEEAPEEPAAPTAGPPARAAPTAGPPARAASPAGPPAGNNIFATTNLLRSKYARASMKRPASADPKAASKAKAAEPLPANKKAASKAGAAGLSSKAAAVTKAGASNKAAAAEPPLSKAECLQIRPEGCSKCRWKPGCTPSCFRARNFRFYTALHIQFPQVTFQVCCYSFKLD